MRKLKFTFIIMAISFLFGCSDNSNNENDGNETNNIITCDGDVILTSQNEIISFF